MRAKRVILGDENPLWRQFYPIVLETLCKGLTQAKPLAWVGGSAIALLFEPVTMILGFASEAISAFVVVGAWFILRGLMAEIHPQLPALLLAVALLAVFHKLIHGLVLAMAFHLSNLITADGFARWLCIGYLEGGPFRQKIVMSEPVQGYLAALSGLMPSEPRTRYDHLMNLYLGSNDPFHEGALKRELEQIKISSSAQPSTAVKSGTQ